MAALSLQTMQRVLVEKEIECTSLSKKDTISISDRWVRTFFESTKAQAGKYQPNRFKWEAYWSGIEQCENGDEALFSYLKNETEPFYIIDESGRNGVECSPQSWPSFLGCGLDVYVFPKSLKWSMAFTHENTCHYARKET